MTRTYYNRRGVRVTDHWIAVEGRRYPISDLRHIGVVRGGLDTRTRMTMFIGPVLSVVLLLLLGPVLPVALSVVLGGALLIVSVVTVVVVSRRYPRWQEMRAEYRGESVLLHGTTDAQDMARLSRALIRALEFASRDRAESTFEPMPREDR